MNKQPQQPLDHPVLKEKAPDTKELQDKVRSLRLRLYTTVAICIVQGAIIVKILSN